MNQRHTSSAPDRGPGASTWLTGRAVAATAVLDVTGSGRSTDVERISRVPGLRIHPDDGLLHAATHEGGSPSRPRA